MLGGSVHYVGDLSLHGPSSLCHYLSAYFPLTFLFFQDTEHLEDQTINFGGSGALEWPEYCRPSLSSSP
jgi:hypothetical protein